MGVLISNGTVVTAQDRWVGNVYCRDGQIQALGEGIEPGTGDEVIDASGQYVFPGGVDPHVHMELRVMGTVSSDDFETGTAAGLAGGTTTIIDFVHPERGQDFLGALAERREEAAKAVADYALHMAVTWWGEGTAQALERCVREEGIPSFKAYFAYKDSVGIDDSEMLQAMQVIGELGGLLLVHAEHGELVEYLRERLAGEGRTEPRYHALSRPSQAEGEATARATVLARSTGASLYVVHVTCREALAAVARARQQGNAVYGETCPQYLLLDDSVYDQPDFEGAAYVIAPPIRSRGHQEALWGALRAGILQVVSTDHCPFLMEQKRMGADDFRRIPGGAAGIEHRLALLYTFGVGMGRIDLHQFVDLVSTRPARLFGLYPRKGSVAVGADGDLVVWDPEATGTISAASHHQRCDRSIFEGFEVKGLPSTVLAAGRVQYQDGDLRVERGAGRYLSRSLGVPLRITNIE
jgi:dihydropyrimidinase